VTRPFGTRPVWRWASLAAALFLLNASLSFENLWPTPAILWRGRLSVELAVCLLLLAALGRWITPFRLRSLAVFWLLLVLGHYAAVTAPALYGRDLNLYWDLRFLPDVAAMVARVAPWWLIILACAAAAAALVALYLALRWALGRVARALVSARARLTLMVMAAATVLLFAGHQMNLHVPELYGFSQPVTRTYALQVRLAVVGLTGSARVAPSPAMNTDLSLVNSADVFLIFIESYGAVSFDRPEFARPLAASRAELERAVRGTNREMVSAFVESPTFGGSSWLARISLLSGVEVRDHDTNLALMSEKRDTLATVFARHGYRTIALMPGLKLPWPEGSFYGFDQTYNAERLAYPGPDFGWFAVPDQFSLAWLDQAEVEQPSRPPLFVFFPTLSTHFPFSPTPPYQPDWPRLLTESKYGGQEIVDAYSDQLDWVDFGPGYVKSLAYAYATIAGYLRLRAGRDFVLILAGDHQPPAAVTGEGASWDVPVHVIASRPAVLERLHAHGFTMGLMPARRPLVRMHELLPILLDGFGGRERQDLQNRAPVPRPRNR
jgi:hypothetical protein